MALPHVAFIGIGALGAPIAARLLAAGVPLTVHNRTAPQDCPLVRGGAQWAVSAADAVAHAQVVMLCLSDGPAVEAVLFGPRGVLAGFSSAHHTPTSASQQPLTPEPETRQSGNHQPKIHQPDTHKPNHQEPEIRQPQTNEVAIREPEIRQPQTNEIEIRESETHASGFRMAGIRESGFHEPEPQGPDHQLPTALDPHAQSQQPGQLAPRPGAPLVIDLSTIEPSHARSIAQRLAARGIAWLDAPVTGGTEGARAGTLSVLVGGEAETLERARPVLELIGTTITHFGPAGTGQQAKAINQILVAGSYAAVAEAMALGQRLGLPMDSLRQALSPGAAGSWALDHRAAGMVAGQFPLGFRLALHRKDLAIALAAADAEGLELPVCRTVAAMEDRLLAAGHGDEDVSALARWFTPPQATAPALAPDPAPRASDAAGAS